MPFVRSRFRILASAVSFLIAVLVLLTGASTFRLEVIEPPEIFTRSFDRTDAVRHEAEVLLVLRERELPLLPDDNHAQRKAAAGVLEGVQS